MAEESLPSDEGLAAHARPATKEDAAVLAQLVNMAGDGLPLYLWTKMAAGGDPWEAGRQRAMRETACVNLARLPPPKRRF